MLPYKVYPAGDTAIIVEFGETIDAKLNRYVLNLAGRLDALALEGLVETVPSFRSLMVQYDPLVLPSGVLLSTVDDLLRHGSVNPPSVRSWRLPACYDRHVADDIDALAERIGMSYSQLIESHSSRSYSVYMLGFLPGQPYLGDLAAELQVPRRSNPRLKIPAGSIAIATSLTSIFPMETPCGWHLIGRTPVQLWKRQVDPGPLLAPGDQVRFEPISLDRFADLSQQAAQSAFAPSLETADVAA